MEPLRLYRLDEWPEVPAILGIAVPPIGEHDVLSITEEGEYWLRYQDWETVCDGCGDPCDGFDGCVVAYHDGPGTGTDVLCPECFRYVDPSLRSDPECSDRMVLAIEGKERAMSETNEQETARPVMLTAEQRRILAALVGNASDDLHEAGSLSGYASMLIEEWPDEDPDDDDELVTGRGSQAVFEVLEGLEATLSQLSALLK